MRLPGMTMTVGLALGLRRRVGRGSCLDLGVAVMVCVVELVKLPGRYRQQLATFEVFDAGVKFDFDAAAGGFPTDSMKGNRARHGPLLGKKAFDAKP